MSRRMIPCQVTDEYVRGDRVVVGAAGSHNDVALRLAFGSMWEGTARSIVWKDALGGNPTVTILGTDLLETGETEVYIVPIPAEPKAYAGDMTMTIKGAVVNGGTETSATLTARAFFTVMESDWDEDAAESGDITPSQAEQLQAEIDDIKGTIRQAQESAAAAKDSEEAAAASAVSAAGSAASAANSATESAQSAVSASGSAADAAASAESARASAELAAEVASGGMAVSVSEHTMLFISSGVQAEVSNTAGEKTMTIGG